MISEREHWLSITDDPDWKRNHIHDPAIDIADEMAVLTREFPENPGRILEIGCGYGRLTSEVARFYPDSEVFGIDVNPAILPFGDDRTTYLCQDTLDGLDGFDAIYSIAVFQHLPDDQKASYVAQAAAALNPGGVIVVQFVDGDCTNFCDYKTPWKRVWKWAEEAGLRAGVEVGQLHPEWAWIVGAK